LTKEAECEVTDDWMLEAFGSGAVQFDVVRGPRDAELLAAGRELTDEVGEALVGGVPAHLGVEDPDDVVGDVVPVHEELGRLRVEEPDPAGPDGEGGRHRARGRLSPH
jgi:hypothetical protein